MMRSLLRITVAALVTAIVGGCGGTKATPKSAAPATQTKSATKLDNNAEREIALSAELPKMMETDFAGPTKFDLLDGSSVDLIGDRRSPILLVYIWASFSPTVEQDVKVIKQALAEDPAGRQAILVCVASPKATVTRVVAEKKIDLPVALDPQASIDSFLPDFQGSVPQLLVIDRNGIVRRRQLGPLEHVNVLASVTDVAGN